MIEAPACGARDISNYDSALGWISSKYLDSPMWGGVFDRKPNKNLSQAMGQAISRWMRPLQDEIFLSCYCVFHRSLKPRDEVHKIVCLRPCYLVKRL